MKTETYDDQGGVRTHSSSDKICQSNSLLRSRLSGCYARSPVRKVPFGGALSDIPKEGCEGDYQSTVNIGIKL